MASQEYIIGRENNVIQMASVIKGLRVVVEQEATLNDGRLYKENTDCWRTLWINVDELKRETEKLIQTLREKLC